MCNKVDLGNWRTVGRGQYICVFHVQLNFFLSLSEIKIHPLFKQNSGRCLEWKNHACLCAKANSNLPICKFRRKSNCKKLLPSNRLIINLNIKMHSISTLRQY